MIVVNVGVGAILGRRKSSIATAEETVNVVWYQQTVIDFLFVL